MHCSGARSLHGVGRLVGVELVLCLVIVEVGRGWGCAGGEPFGVLRAWVGPHRRRLVMVSVLATVGRDRLLALLNRYGTR